MRLLMMGTGPFAVPTFESLLDSEHQVLGLVTRPVPPAARRKGPANPMRDLAEARGLAIYDPPDVNAAEARAWLRERGPEALVVCDYGQILSRDVLGLVPRGGINLHASLLPEYRGAAPINWALLEGREVTGVTVIHMTARLDSGPCLVQISTAIGPDEDAVSLEQRLSRLGVEAVRSAIAQLAAWDGSSDLGRVQDSARATRAPRLKKTDGWVDWARSAQQIFNQVRGLKPWPGTFTQWFHPGGDPERILLDRVRVVDQAAEPGQVSGEIVQVQGGRVLVGTGNGLLSLERIQPASKRVMDISEFLRGHSMRPGQRLGGGP